MYNKLLYLKYIKQLILKINKIYNFQDGLQIEFLYKKLILAFFAGVALTFAFAPYNYVIIIPFSFFVLLLLIECTARTTYNAIHTTTATATTATATTINNLIHNRKCWNYGLWHSFWVGFIFGIGHFVSSLYWIAYSLSIDYKSYWWLIPCCLLVIPAIISCFISIISALTYWLMLHIKLHRQKYFIPKLSNEYHNEYHSESIMLKKYDFLTCDQKIKTALFFSSLWYIVEFIRSYSILPFPWNLIGYSINDSDRLMQLASIIGVHGVGFVLIICAMTLYVRNIYWTLNILVILITCLIFGEFRLSKIIQYENAYNVSQIDNTMDLNDPIDLLLEQKKIFNILYQPETFRIVQPNIALLDPYVNELNSTKLLNNVEKLVDISLSLPLLSKDKTSDINHNIIDNYGINYLIWPESAIPFVIDNKMDLTKLLNAFSLNKQYNTPLLKTHNNEPKECNDRVLYANTTNHSYKDKNDNEKLNDNKKLNNLNFSYLVTGLDEYENDKIYNAMALIDSKNKIVDIYRKKILVPFGEYIPLYKLLNFIKIVSTYGQYGFSSGDIAKINLSTNSSLANLSTTNSSTISIIRKDDITHDNVMNDNVMNENNNVNYANATTNSITNSIHNTSLGPYICYEAIFPPFILLNFDHSVRFIVNITNDMWFGNSIGPYQHLAMVQMRAVEYGIPILRSANTGISAVIDSYGRILNKIDLNKIGVIDGYIPQKTSKPTFYYIYYNKINVIFFLFAMCIIIVCCINNNNTSSGNRSNY